MPYKSKSYIPYQLSASAFLHAKVPSFFLQFLMKKTQYFSSKHYHNNNYHCQPYLYSCSYFFLQL